MRIELRIDRLVIDDLGACSSRELVTAITEELRRVLAHDLGRPQVMAHQAVSVPRLRAALALPAAGVTATSAGQAIGATLAGAVTSERVFPRARGRR